MRSRFDYALHELPLGVLYGHDGATIEECGELLEELEGYERLADQVGHEGDRDLISKARFHIPAYRQYLEEHDRYTTYAQYLSLHSSGVRMD
ncbi:hypothetical protein OKA05_04655 [Luteolibacter arcticus]|uniref:Uncharacterized protein n=1 Tax=Luteolibacter arcticus TaxID=1581411 RepID=A0ABT3GEU3_9BACT|nr:hypothetical protein [Luteolibacter arcticus]MCW1921830.1 hypothetical protein [Luteolibacter arcticus]